MFNIITHRKLWLTFSSTLVILSIVVLYLWKFNFGIDFTGGSLMEVKFEGARPDIAQVESALKELDLKSLTIQPVGDKNMILRFQDVNPDVHKKITDKLNEVATKVAGSNKENKIDELQFNSIGPSIGQQLKQQSVYAMFWVWIAIVLYISWAFRKVSKPVSSWKYGLAALFAMFHDVIITCGVFAILGHFYGVEINAPFVAAVLTVLGYSVNDTIVVFDRIRENLPKSDQDFAGTVNTSLNQTIRRSIFTSLTVMLALLAVMVFGSTNVRDFVLALFIGILVGTYSSIFVASPMLVVWEKMKAIKN
jgi:preprotein translocase subunit SecF